MQKLWLLAAAVGAILAAVFLYRDNVDAAFISAVLGVVSWFLSYRARIKPTIPTEETE